MKPLRPALSLFALPAGLIALLPAGHDALLYDRAAILRGEIWRLWTGHWVHFSASHLCWNLGVLLVAGTCLEHARPGLLRRYTLLAAPLISAAFLVCAPAMHTYGGLSGLATGLVTLLALIQLGDSRADRVRWGAVLALVAAKITLDALQSGPLFSGFEAAAIRSSALAHAAGATLALLFFLSPRGLASLPLSGSSPVGRPSSENSS